jgi:hypothetical protein
MHERIPRPRKTIRRATAHKPPRMVVSPRSDQTEVAPRTDRLGRVLEEWLAEAQIRYTHPGE